MPRGLSIFLALGVACGGSDAGDGDETSTTVGADSTSSSTTMPTTSTTASTSTADGSSGSSSSTTDAPESSSEASSSTGPAGDTVTLQNDAWTPADSLTWQTWPSPEDCWASSYEIDPSLYPFDIVAVDAAIGGADDVRTFELGIWELDGEGLPAQAIDSAEVEVTGNVQLAIELAGLLDVPTITEGGFAVVMCHVDHMGTPSIAIDVDGTVDGDHNFVFQASDGDWVRSPDFFGTSGDFVLRTTVRPL